MELLSGGFYLVEYFFTLGVNGLMNLMEIQNQDHIRPILEQVPVSTRSLPALIMFAAASKCLLLLILNIYIAIIFTSAFWKVCKENEDVVKTLRSLDIQQQQPVATPAQPMHDVNVRVRPIEPENNTHDGTATTSRNRQPPYNPYMNGSKSPKKNESRF